MPTFVPEASLGDFGHSSSVSRQEGSAFAINLSQLSLFKLQTYIRKLLHMDIAWLESRHSGQVASVLNESVLVFAEKIC